MKIAVSLLSLFVLALSVMPCADVSAADNSRSTINRVSTEEHHSHETDHCTPFCVCNCCQTPADQHLFSSETTAFQPAESASSFPARDDSFASNYYGNIWQPPKN